MSLLKFLNSAKVEEVVAPAKGTGGVKKERIPDGLAIRLFRDGSIYPSQALVDKFNLEYKTGTPVKEEIKNKVMEGIAKIPGAETDLPKYKTVFTFDNGEGNGFDLIDSRQWHQFKAEEGFALIFVSPVPKNEAKVDLFGIVRRDDTTGAPTSSVMEQGAATKGEIMLQMVEEIYNVKLSQDDKDGLPEFVDLAVTDVIEGFNVTEKFSQPISMFPKLVARGDAKGKPSYERRDNAKVYALVPVAMLGTVSETTVTQAPAAKKTADALVV